MLKKRKWICLCLVFIFTGSVYFSRIMAPMYNGRLAIDLSNNTWQTIQGAAISFEHSDVMINLPNIYPQERIILLAPTNIFDRPIKTQVFVHLNGHQYVIMDEYHTLVGDKYHQDLPQVTQATIKNNEIITSYNGLFNLGFKIKPYFRVVDLGLNK